MLTLDRQEILIDRLKSLTELELQTVFEELAEHLRKQKLSHVAHTAFGGNPKELEDLRDEIAELEEKIGNAQSALE